jgi:hypothetical protein
MDKEEIFKLELELKLANETLEKSLKTSHAYIEETFYNTRTSIISNFKSYLVNLSIVSATIIPFSSLVFQIPERILTVNVIFWFLALFAFIASLISFILSFLKLIDIERGFYVKILLSYIGSGSIDFISISNKNEQDKITEMVDVLNSQDKFRRDHKNYIDEKEFIGLVKRIKISSWLFILGLIFFFVSILLPKFLEVICTR